MQLFVATESRTNFGAFERRTRGSCIFRRNDILHNQLDFRTPNRGRNWNCSFPHFGMTWGCVQQVFCRIPSFTNELAWQRKHHSPCRRPTRQHWSREEQCDITAVRTRLKKTRRMSRSVQNTTQLSVFHGLRMRINSMFPLSHVCTYELPIEVLSSAPTDYKRVQ
jgi:hypothetical protein